jgi:hypothetical protein
MSLLRTVHDRLTAMAGEGGAIKISKTINDNLNMSGLCISHIKLNSVNVEWRPLKFHDEIVSLYCVSDLKHLCTKTNLSQFIKKTTSKLVYFLNFFFINSYLLSTLFSGYIIKHFYI